MMTWNCYEVLHVHTINKLHALKQVRTRFKGSCCPAGGAGAAPGGAGVAFGGTGAPGFAPGSGGAVTPGGSGGGVTPAGGGGNGGAAVPGGSGGDVTAIGAFGGPVGGATGGAGPPGVASRRRESISAAVIPCRLLTKRSRQICGCCTEAISAGSSSTSTAWLMCKPSRCSTVQTNSAFETCSAESGWPSSFEGSWLSLS